MLISATDRVQISKLNLNYAIVILLFCNFFYAGKNAYRETGNVKRERAREISTSFFHIGNRQSSFASAFCRRQHYQLCQRYQLSG